MPPVPGSVRCNPCRQHRGHAGLADETAFVTYAVAGRQSGHVMRGYKATPQPIAEHRMVENLLLAVGLAGHGSCPSLAAGRPVTHWAAIPSLPAKPTTEKPLARAIEELRASGAEVAIVGPLWRRSA